MCRRLRVPLLTLSLTLLACAPPAPTAATPSPAEPTAGVRFVPVGPAGGAPSRVLMEFGRPVRTATGPVGDGVVDFEVEPPTPGALAFETPSTLAWTPTEPLAPGTRYHLTVRRVIGDRGPIEPAQPWIYRLDTPAFGLVDLSLVRADPARGRVSLRARFSAAVDVARLPEFATWSVGAQVVSGAELRPESTPGEVHVSLSHPAITPEAVVTLRLAEGLSHANGARAAAATRAVTVGEPARWRVLAMHPEETQSGYAVRIICDDRAAGPARPWWDGRLRTEFRRSSTCLPDEDARRRIRVTPAVPFKLARAHGGFRLEGAFRRGRYTVQIDAGARTDEGAELAETVTIAVEVPRRSDRVRVIHDGRYLPRSAWGALAIEHLNTDHVDLTIHHIPARNLVYWLGAYDEDPGDRTADAVVSARVPVKGAADTLTTSTIDLRRWLAEPASGIYAVRVATESSHDARRLLVSDLQLVAKRGVGPDAARTVWVWALDAHTVRPRAGVDVQLVRASGTAVGSCRTSRDGGCHIRVSGPAADPEPVALVARQGDALTYLAFDDVPTRLRDAATWGAPYRAEAAYVAAPWTDRDLYRPGERVHLAAVIRDPTGVAPEAGLPVVVRLEDPEGRTVRRRVARTDAVGLVTLDLALPEAGPTGRWTSHLEVADAHLASSSIHVEPFVPERMRVAARGVAPAVMAGGAAAFVVSARSLFGGTAEGARVEGRCRFEPGRVAPDGPDGYVFGVVAGAGTELGPVDATLGADGAVRVECPLPAEGLPGGRVVLDAAVLEAGSGRASRATASLAWRPTAFALGLTTASDEVRPNAPLKVAGALVDWAGSAAPIQAVTLTLHRLKAVQGWRWDAASGAQRWQRSLRPIAESMVTVPVIDGRFDAILDVGEAGEAFRLEAVAGDARAVVELDGTLDRMAWRYSRDWDHHDPSRTPGPARAAAVRVVAPETVALGAPFEAVFHAPYAGRALLTVETDGVLSSRWVAAKAGPNRWPVRVDRFAPNVYLGVFVAKDPHLESAEAYLPDRAAGALSVRVAPADRVFSPEVSVPDEIRPASPLTVRVDAGARPDGPAFVVVAAVDEGVLQMTGFEAPDPNAALFARRRLGVDTFDTLGWAVRLGEGGGRQPIGGGAGAGAGVTPVVAPMALWSGPVALDARGRADVTLAVPRYRGQLRVMAVVVDRRRVGATEAKVRVRDPLALQASLPAQLTQGDRVDVPVRLTNSTAAAQMVTVRLRAEGLAAVGAVSQSVNLGPGLADTLVFGAEVTAAQGVGQVTVEATAGALRSVDTVRAALRPAGVRARRVARVAVLPGGATPLPGALAAWAPGAPVETLVRVSANPLDAGLSHLESLIEYPHGCLEQTTSRARSLLALGPLFEDLLPGRAATTGLADRVAAGVDRLLSMQTAEGGLAYWPGQDTPHAWGTANAALFLVDARDAGHAVPADRLEAVLGWLARYTEQPERVPHVEAWAHYALARAGRARTARLRRIAEGLAPKPEGTEQERAALIWAALHRAGDRRYADPLRALVAAPAARDARGAHFWSAARGHAVVLALGVDRLPTDAVLTAPMTVLAARLRGADVRWTTAELGWSLLALARWARARDDAVGPVRLVAGADAVAPRRPGARSWVVAGAPADLVVHGERPATATVLQSGTVPAEQAWTGHEGLRVERDWLDAHGRSVDPERVRLGQLLFVRLRLTNGQARRVENVALTDGLPAGFAHEGARIADTAPPTWAAPERAWATTYVVGRDEGASFYGPLEAGASVEVIYPVRAVAAGRFHAPGAAAEAMYDPARRARTPAGTVRVLAPWSERI